MKFVRVWFKDEKVCDYVGIDRSAIEQLIESHLSLGVFNSQPGRVQEISEEVFCNTHNAQAIGDSFWALKSRACNVCAIVLKD